MFSHRFSIENKGNTAHRVRVRLVLGRAFGIRLRVSREVRVDKRSSVDVVLFHPQLRNIIPKVLIAVDGVEDPPFRLASTHRGSELSDKKEVTILLGSSHWARLSYRMKRAHRLHSRYYKGSRSYRYKSRYLYRYRYGYGYRYRRAYRHRSVPSWAAPLLKKKKQAFSYQPFAFLHTDLPANKWGHDWHAFSRFGAVVVSSQQMASLSSATRHALIRYVEVGGTLVVTGKWDGAPDSWKRGATNHAHWQQYTAGFGVCFVYKGTLALTEQADASIWTPVLAAAHRSHIPMTYVHSPTEAHSVFPVVDDLKIPSRGIFFMMLFFCLVIGPLNLFVLKRMGKSLWILWTLPLGALLTCVSLVIYTTASEGWGGHTRIGSLTFLDQQNKRAATLGIVGMYSPIVPSSGLLLERDTQFLPHLSEMSRRLMADGQQRNLSIDLTHGLHLQQGWMVSRVPFHMTFRKSELREEKLVLKHEAGKWMVLNGLGAGIKKLFLANARGERFQVKDIGMGQKVRLKPMSGWDDSGCKHVSLRSVFPRDWLKHIEASQKKPWCYLRPGSYLAVLDRASFVAPSLRQFSRKRISAVVWGKLEASNGR
jgi:hypothetical protein